MKFALPVNLRFTLLGIVGVVADPSSATESGISIVQPLAHGALLYAVTSLSVQCLPAVNGVSTTTELIRPLVMPDGFEDAPPRSADAAAVPAPVLLPTPV